MTSLACKHCERTYSHYSSLYRHQSTCKPKPVEPDIPKEDNSIEVHYEKDYKDCIISMQQQMLKMQGQMLKMQEQMLKMQERIHNNDNMLSEMLSEIKK